MKKINSEEYWDKRFRSDWDLKNGDKQSIFFMDIALSSMPEWLKKELRKKGKSICDWGCAEGDGTNLLSRIFSSASVTGIDFAKSAIDKAKARYKVNNLSFTQIDLLTTKHEKQYDVVFCSNTLEHFKDPWEVFNKVSNYAKEIFIIMVPFNEKEDELYEEHQHRFIRDDFSLNRGDWSLIHFEVINTAKYQNTLWNGQQAFIVYVKDRYLAKHNFTFGEIDLSGDAKITVASKFEKIIDQLKNRQFQLEENLSNKDRQIHEQNIKIIELSQLVNSRRYRFSVSLANFAGIIIPPQTLRRRVVAAPFRIHRLINESPEARKAREKVENETKRKNELKKGITRLANNHSTVIVLESMPWDNILRQRPHHIAEQLANLGHLVIYIDAFPESKPRKLNDNLVIVDGDWCIGVIDKSKIEKKYYMAMSTSPKPFEDIKNIVNKGYKLIYEYIDELNETISGDLTHQREVFSRLKELRPVLLTATAKKLYEELVETFPKRKIIMNPNAVDITHFDQAISRYKEYAPNDIKKILDLGNPIVGYYGAIAPWLDYKLINRVTKERSNISFVFIGIDYNDALKNLVFRKNVFYLGPKEYSTLPEYSYWFDCALIPFKNGEIAKTTSPVKLFEYMAMGIPTVCTRDLRECMGYDYVYISKDVTEFKNNMDKAITNKKSPSVRQALLNQTLENTWQARAKAISERIDEPHDLVRVNR